VRDDVIGGISADYSGIKNMLCGVFNASMRAFEFLPKNDEGGRGEMDARWLAWISAEAARKLNETTERILWNCPLGMAAFAFIECLAEKGISISRPVDDKRQMEELKRQVEAQAA
jgi:hypothetical protein